MIFVAEFKVDGELAGGKLLPSYNALDADTLPLAVRAVQKAIDEGVADECVIYAPIRIVRAARRVEIVDPATQRVVTVDSSTLPPAESLEKLVETSSSAGSTAGSVVGK